MYRTDMARELMDLHRGIQGAWEQTERDADLEISRICIESDEAARMLGKPKGNYITIELPEETTFTEDTQKRAIACIAGELRKLMTRLPENADILVAGLGNRFVTPDSLGPCTVDKVFVTRHIRTHLPEAAPEGMRAVSALSPGVLGTTGVETVEILAGLIKRLRPGALLCIDALASMRADRISASIQMNDTGVQPGAGVHNRRSGIHADSMGVPVFAIGVPTVVEAGTIIKSAIERLIKETGVEDTEHTLQKLGEKLTGETVSELMVTPKEIDAVIERASKRLAEGINHALHGSAYEELKIMMQS